VLAQDDILNAKELVQWENGLSFDDIAARQGIRIRRHNHPTASLKEIEEELGAPRNILEKIIWDKEIEVAEVCSCISVHALDFRGSIW
jgi:indole-3-glycerol phosphate synthase